MVKLSKSSRKGKKWQVLINNRTVHFGASGYQDYTQHGDEKRRASYIARHGPRETWGLAGVDTAGFWARWLLWNKPTIRESIRDIEGRFGISIDLS